MRRRRRSLRTRTPEARPARAESGRQRSIERLKSDVDSIPSPSELDRPMLGDLSAPSPAPNSLSESDLARLKAENRNLRRLHETVHFLAAADSLETLIPEVVGMGTSISGLTRGLLALLGNKNDAGDRAFTVRVVRGIARAERSSPEVRVLRRILAKTLEERKAIFEPDARRSDPARDERSEELALGAVAALPLEADGELLGALLLDEPTRRSPFTRHETELLLSFARHAALALSRLSQNTRLARRSERLKTEREALRSQLEETQHELEVLKTRSGRLAAASSRILRREAEASGSGAGRALETFLGRSFATAKRGFLKHYLEQAIERAEGDLEKAARATGMSVAKLVKLLELYEVRPHRKPVRSGSSASWEGLDGSPP